MGNEIPTKAREVVRERQGGQCLRCGNRASVLHHRKRRREGGHGYENLVALCNTCHVSVHKHPTVSQEHGYIVPTHVEDVGSVPLKSFMGWVLFDNDGGMASVE